MENTLYYGDNLDILKRYISDESIDLVYLDPPFKSNQSYNILFKEKNGSQAASQIRAFEDTWTWGQDDEAVYADLVTKGGRVADCLQAFRTFMGSCDMLAYLVMMAPRLAELRRVMKPTASIYLHCDPTASHYLKMLLDAVFGADCFRSEIIWRRTGAHSPLRGFGPIHDTLLFYTRDPKDYFFNIVRSPYMKGHVERRYTKDEGTGKLQFTSGGNVLTGAGATGGESGKPWRGFDPSAKNRHWAIPGFLAEQMPESFKELGVLAKLDALYEVGLIEITEGVAWPVPVRYLREGDGNPLGDIWACQPYTEGTVYGTDEGIDADVQWLGPTAPERLGYPTQKPAGLLARVIRSSCPVNGVVLDPFCGCGTTIAAAQKLKRRWIGIDITHLAITLMKKRLLDAFGTEAKFNVIGEPTSLPDAAALAESDPYQFQWWALGLVGARPVEQKKGADKGIDGKIIFQGDAPGIFEQVILSVKAGHTGRDHVHSLRGVMDGQKAAIGVLISMQNPTGPMKEEAVTAGFFESKTWGKKYPKIQLLTIAELLAGKKIDMPPIRQVDKTFKKAERFKGDRSEQLGLTGKEK